MIFASGALIVLAAQNLPARLLALPGDDLRDAVLSGDKFSDEDFTAFVKAREAAIGWRNMAEYRGELSAAYAARAAADGTPVNVADDYMQKSLDNQLQALRLEPADTYGWSQLTYLDMQGTNDLPRAADDLDMSIETAPYEPNLMAARLDMMVALRDQLFPEDAREMPTVARQAWAADPHMVAVQAQSHHYVSLIERALANDEQATTYFHSLLVPAPAAPAAQPAP